MLEMMVNKDDVSALAMGWLTIPAAGDLSTKKSADGKDIECLPVPSDF